MQLKINLWFTVVVAIVAAAAATLFLQCSLCFLSMTTCVHVVCVCLFLHSRCALLYCVRRTVARWCLIIGSEYLCAVMLYSGIIIYKIIKPHNIIWNEEKKNERKPEKKETHNTENMNLTCYKHDVCVCFVANFNLFFIVLWTEKK